MPNNKLLEKFIQVEDKEEFVRILADDNLRMAEALRFYTNYDKETVRHMDTEFLKPERMAVIKPLDKIGKGYAPEDMHPSQIYQDKVFTYGPRP